MSQTYFELVDTDDNNHVDFIEFVLYMTTSRWKFDYLENEDAVE